MSITRRLFLRNTAVLPLGAATLAAVAAKAEPATPTLEPLVYAADRVNMWEHPPITPQERFDKAVLELKRAVQAIDPTVADWIVKFAANDDLDFRFMAIASSKPNGEGGAA